MKKRPSKHLSLRLKLIVLVTLCWLIPLLAIFATLAYDVSKNNKERLENEYTADLLHSISIVQLHLSQSIASSRNASYDQKLGEAYSSFLGSNNQAELSQKTNSYLTQQYRYDEKFITAVVYYHSTEISQPFFTTNPNTGGSYDSYRFYQNNVHPEVTKLAATLDTKIQFINHQGKLYLVRNIVNNRFKPYATIVIQLNTAYILSPIEGLIWSDGALLYLNNTKYTLNGLTEGFSDTALGSPQNPTTQGVSIGKNQDQVYLHGKNIGDDVTLSYLVAVNENGFLEQFSDYSILLYFLIGILILLSIYVLFFAYKNIINPINNLITTAKIIEGGDYGYQTAQIGNNKEFHYLNDAVNHMSSKLKEQFQTIYNEELALRDAKLMALQSQINPHFLNNTLEIINWKARLAGDNQVSSMIEALSTMLHAATDRNSLPLIPLKEELEYVNAYLYIVKERFGKRLDITTTIDTNTLKWEVPRLILQPIIENAIYHGMKAVDTCKISVSAFLKEDQLIIETHNNSPLSSKDRHVIDTLLSGNKQNSEFHTKMGIYNVNARLKILYGKHAGLTIVSDENETIARLTITK